MTKLKSFQEAELEFEPGFPEPHICCNISVSYIFQLYSNTEHHACHIVGTLVPTCVEWLSDK